MQVEPVTSSFKTCMHAPNSLLNELRTWLLISISNHYQQQHIGKHDKFQFLFSVNRYRKA